MIVSITRLSGDESPRDQNRTQNPKRRMALARMRQHPQTNHDLLLSSTGLVLCVSLLRFPSYAASGDRIGVDTSFGSNDCRESGKNRSFSGPAFV